MRGPTIETLSRVPLFADLDDDELQVIADAMRERTFPAGETVTEEGAIADGFFVIASGEADVVVQG